MKTEAFNAENMRFLTDCANERFGILKVKDWLRKRKLLEDLEEAKKNSLYPLFESRIKDFDIEDLSKEQSQFIYKAFPDIFTQMKEQKEIKFL